MFLNEKTGYKEISLNKNIPMTKIQLQAEAGNIQYINDVQCRYCTLRKLCKPADDSNNESIPDNLVKHQKKISKTQHLFKSDEIFKNVFAVKSGMFKSVYHFDDGREQIIDFHLPGELIGFDAIDNDRYTCSVVAITNSSYCEMNLPSHAPHEIKNDLIGHMEFQNNVIEALSKQARLDQHKSLIIGAMNVEQKLAIFLTSIYTRLEAHSMPSECFTIPMRKDIANYLGVAIETVVRLLKKLEKNQLITSCGKQVTLSNYEEIKKLSRL
ncbi:hypothetical protein MNBD_GAMMA09-3527 [hydrothermal vent metagenome]|uniref:HTH crp-type domain-containing protein n=1 Tax=hydrothermal vent metagenome TaxID=652676 RepID=A0A3B0XVP9_9ZZZZ